MSNLTLQLQRRGARCGLKGPRAAEWLVVQGVIVPTAANSWAQAPGSADRDALLVARLGQSEFFLEDGAAATTLAKIAPALSAPPPGVYPVLREDWGLRLAGAGVHEVLAQVCNVNFAALRPDCRPLVMTLMIGVAVLVVAQNGAKGDDAERQFRIWCDPTYGPYLAESLGAVVVEGGGRYIGDPP